jgi:D-lactate dehydrogenase (cytochrome)
LLTMFGLFARRVSSASKAGRGRVYLAGAAASAGFGLYSFRKEEQTCFAMADTKKELVNIEPLLSELKGVLRDDQIERDVRECQSRGKPWSSFHKISEYPQLIVFPESTQNVSDIMRLCYKYSVPVVPFGGGTSLEGQILASRGGLSLDFNHMKTVVELNEKDMDMTVQAGLGYVELNEILKDKGLWFPLDPGPGATVGGMCACRCSGSTAVKYGSMR